MGNVIDWGTAESTGGDGVFLSLADAKNYLRVTSTDEDDVIADLIAAAERFIEAEVGRFLTAVSATEHVSVGRNSRGFGVRNWPVSSTATITVTDPNATDVTGIFDVDYTTGRFRAYHLITAGTYTVTYTGGVSLSDSWAATRASLVNAVRDLVAEWYANRDPGASSVTDGDYSRVTASPVTGADGGVPPRVMAVIKLLRGW